MLKPIFFTGTGTNIGKTHVLCALLAAHKAAGGQARILKPVAPGFLNTAISETDTARLLKAKGQDITTDTIKATTPWRFKFAMSPDLAARKENRDLFLQPVVDWCFDHIHPNHPTVIEGTGGLMSPIAEDGLNLDLINELDAHPVLVAGNYPGTISHVLTALRSMDRRCTVILNERKPGPASAEETARSIKRFAPRADIHIFNPNNLTPILRAITAVNSGPVI